MLCDLQPLRINKLNSTEDATEFELAAIELSCAAAAQVLKADSSEPTSSSPLIWTFGFNRRFVFNLAKLCIQSHMWGVRFVESVFNFASIQSWARNRVWCERLV